MEVKRRDQQSKVFTGTIAGGVFLGIVGAVFGIPIALLLLFVLFTFGFLVAGEGGAMLVLLGALALGGWLFWVIVRFAKHKKTAHD